MRSLDAIRALNLQNVMRYDDCVPAGGYRHGYVNTKLCRLRKKGRNESVNAIFMACPECGEKVRVPNPDKSYHGENALRCPKGHVLHFNPRVEKKLFSPERTEA